MNHQSSTINHYTLTLGWLYPDLMSTYGDRGNIFVLQKRCADRNIELTIVPITQETTIENLKTIDIIFGGGSQDRQQEIVMRDLHGKKGSVIKDKIEQGTPALFVCGSPQLMGKSYEPGIGKSIEGLGIFDMESKHPGPNTPRLIGNIVAKVNWEYLEVRTVIENEQSERGKPNEITSSLSPSNDGFPYIVGFENHGGRTYLGDGAKPFARVVKGNGNNGEDGTEGVVYKNAIGCYFHGPLLPKNPQIADFIIQRSLEVKYQKEIRLKPINSSLEIQANHAIVKRLGIKI